MAAQVKFISARDEEFRRLVVEVKAKDDCHAFVYDENEGLQEALTNAIDQRRWLLKFGIPKVNSSEFRVCLILRADFTLVFRFSGLSRMDLNLGIALGQLFARRGLCHGSRGAPTY